MLLGVRRGQSYDVHACSTSALQAVDTVFQHHALIRTHAKTLSTLQIAVGRGLALSKVLTGQNRVKEGFELRGASGESFGAIVAFGANASDPHHGNDDTRLRDGDCVLIDMGCVWKDYCSDMTRTKFFRSVTQEQKEVYEIVRKANETAKAMIRPGVRFCDIDAAARDVIEEAGYGEYFTHRLGHGIGLTEHEPEDVGPANPHPVKPGMVFSIEPGIYLPGKFGVRIEDLVIVTEDGCECINKDSRELQVI